jgi:hypothetical protein
VTAVIVAVASGCGSSQEPPAAKGPTPPKSASPSSAPSSAAAWPRFIDQESGVRFSLPERVKPEVRTQAQATARNYAVEVSKHVQVSVGVLDFDSELPPDYMRATMQQIVTSLTNEGATDAKLSDVRTANVEGAQSALDGTVSFTSKPGPKAHWRLRSIVLEGHAILIQVVSFREEGDTTTISLANSVFDRVTASIVID